MANPKSKDLFDDSTMSFGEHLESLRFHLWKAIIGLVIAVILSLFFGNYIIAIVRGPIDRALREHNFGSEQITDEIGGFNFLEHVKGWFSSDEEQTKIEVAKEKTRRNQETARGDPKVIVAEFKAADLVGALRKLNPELVENVGEPDEEQMLELPIRADEFSQLRTLVGKSSEAVTLTVQEAFMTYLKVALIAGLVIAMPWIFYQMWLFVAAGLYPHERKYVYIYLPMSVGLFGLGAVFCFYFVFPFVLDFLLGFNAKLNVNPQIRLSEWISFAIMLPVMFGLSFQLPLVMLFLERISIFEAKDYREKRRMSILVIAVISMFLTPADPMSMMMMMIPLLLLYELGIWLCGVSPARRPFEAAEV